MPYRLSCLGLTFPLCVVGDKLGVGIRKGILFHSLLASEKIWWRLKLLYMGVKVLLQYSIIYTVLHCNM